MMFWITRFTSMLAALLCFAQAVSASDIMIMNAMARASLTPVAKTGAVYFFIMNHGTTDDRLLSLSTPAAAKATLHDTTMVADVMKMREIEGGLGVPAGTTVALKPGATHVMLTGLRAPLAKGNTVMLELVFEKAGVVKLGVPVGGIAEGHEHPE